MFENNKKKVSFNIASQVLRGQKLIENTKRGLILASFWKPDAYGQTMLQDRLISIGQKLVENA